MGCRGWQAESHKGVIDWLPALNLPAKLVRKHPDRTVAVEMCERREFSLSNYLAPAV